MPQKKYDLEDRLVNYTCLMIDTVESLPNSKAGNYIAGLLIKSCHAQHLITKKHKELTLQRILSIKWE